MKYEQRTFYRYSRFKSEVRRRGIYSYYLSNTEFTKGVKVKYIKETYTILQVRRFFIIVKLRIMQSKYGRANIKRK